MAAHPSSASHGPLAVALDARRDVELLLAELERWPRRVFLDAGVLARQCRLPVSRVRAALDRMTSSGALERGRAGEPTYRLIGPGRLRSARSDRR